MLALILILGIMLSTVGLFGALVMHCQRPCRDENTGVSPRAGLLLLSAVGLNCTMMSPAARSGHESTEQGKQGVSLVGRYRYRGHERQPGHSERLSLTSGCVHWWLGVACGLLWLGLWPAWLLAEESGSISGVIQRAGQGVAAHRIMLIRMGPQQEVQRTPGQTDAHGAFRFAHLATGPEYTYYVGIRYKEQLYRSDPVDRKSTRLNSSHLGISYAVFCLK